MQGTCALTNSTRLRTRASVRARTGQAEPELSQVENFENNKRLQTQVRACVLLLLSPPAGCAGCCTSQPFFAAQVAPVAEDTVTIRSLDWDRDRFDIEFG